MALLTELMNSLSSWFYKHLAPNGARDNHGDSGCYKPVAPDGAKSRRAFPHVRRPGRDQIRIIRRLSIPRSLQQGEIKICYGTNSDVSSAPPRLGSFALIFTTLCESLAIPIVCVSASSSSATRATT